MTGLIEITLGGEVRTLKFGNFALLTYNQLTSTNAGEVKQMSDEYSYMDFIRDITYCGLKNWYKIQNKTFDVTLEDITLWIDDANLNDLQKVLLCWIESNALSQMVQDVANSMATETPTEEVKKK